MKRGFGEESLGFFSPYRLFPFQNERSREPGVVAQLANPSTKAKLVHVPVASFLIQSPAYGLRKQALRPCTHVRDATGTPDLQLWNGPALATVTIRGVSQQMEDLALKH